MPQSGQTMPPGSIPEGSPSGVIDNARKVSRDGWNRHGNQTAEQALANDKNLVRKPIDPTTVAGPKGSVSK